MMGVKGLPMMYEFSVCGWKHIMYCAHVGDELCIMHTTPKVLNPVII